MKGVAQVKPTGVARQDQSPIPLNVARRTPAPYGPLCEGIRMLFKALMCSMLVFVAVGAVGIWLRRRRGY